MDEYLIDRIPARESSDVELLERTRRGDNYAFSELVRRYKTRLASTIQGIIGRCDEVDDVCQEVFIRFHNSIHNFRGESALSTYLTRIAINLSLNELKRRKLKRFLSLETMKKEGSEIASMDVTTDDKEIIQRALGKLNNKFRTVIVLRLIEEYSTEETAEILNVPIGTVLSRLARAQKKLKEYINPYYENEKSKT